MEITSSAPFPSPEPEPRLIAGRRIDWTPREVLFGILWFIAVFIVLPLPFVVSAVQVWGRDSSEVSAIALALGLPAEVALAGYAVRFSFRKYGGSWERLGFTPISWPVAGWALAAFVGALAFSFGWAGIVQAFDIEALKSSCDEQIPKSVLNNNALMALAGVAIIGFAPLFEEIFFRGFVFPGIANRWGIAVGIAVSAAIFATGHGSLKAFVPILAIGAILALTYQRSGSLLSPILAHLAFNSLSFVALLTADCT